MPKIKETQAAFNRRMCNEHQGVFRCDDSVLFCLFCDTNILAKQVFQVKQHLGTSKHLSSIERKNKNHNYGPKSSQTLLTTMSSENDRDSKMFSMDLAKCFLEANIPLHKISHPTVVKFVEKHTKYAAPSETSLRTKYLPELYNECIEKMKRIAAKNYIWVSIDETTDSQQRFVANFVFGVLGIEDERGRSYLFSSVVLQTTNASTIATFFDDSLKELDVDRNKVLLFVSDAAPYMVSAMKALNVLFPKMIHVTCAAHGLHRVADFIKDQFNDVNELISNVKKIFMKSARRKQLFKANHPNLAFPPEPIITRWGTWINAALYYADHFQEITSFLNELDSNDAASIGRAKAIISKKNIKRDLTFIKCHFSRIPKAIKTLEEKGAPLTEAIRTFMSVRNDLNIDKRKEFQEKFDFVYHKNIGLKSLQCIVAILDGTEDSETKMDEMSPSELAAFKYAPITSCDVERTFSAYKRLLEDCRHSFIFDNLKKHLIIHCNKFD